MKTHARTVIGFMEAKTVSVMLTFVKTDIMETFYDFLCSMPKQEDAAANQFISMCRIDDDFPRCNDPAKLAIHLYLKIDPKMTSTFQKLLMLYHHVHPDRLPKRAFARQDMALATINLIVGLQNASTEYKWN